MKEISIDMDESPEIKLSRQRLSALRLAEALWNVSEACRCRGISRTQFYEYKLTKNALIGAIATGANAP